MPNFSSLLAAITELTTNRHSRLVKWNEEAAEAFSKLKMMLCTRPMLQSPDFTKESEVGLGAVLSQTHKGEEHPVLYISRRLAKHENNYATIETECLAIKSKIFFDT